MGANERTTEWLPHLSLCSGYGGLDLGLAGVLPDLRTLCYVEINIFNIQNLVTKMEQGYLDEAPIWTDVKTLPLGILRDILGRECIISSGFPCQPFSTSGERRGDQDPRHLWPYIKDAIRVIQPRWVWIENVEGIVSARLKGDNWSDPEGTPVLLHVLRELERLGYRAEAGIFSAEEVGLPHQRRRVFILANSQRKCGEVSSARKLRTIKESGSNGQTRGVVPSRPGEPQHAWEPPRAIHEVESSVGGSFDGTTRRMGYAELCQSYDSRFDELIALGNGVVPATASKAFLTLLERLQ